MLAQILDNDEAKKDIDVVLARLLAAAKARLSGQTQEGEGPDLHQLVAEHAPTSWRFTHRTPNGRLWSEAVGREVSRNEFVTSTTTPLIGVCSEARDIPRTCDQKPCRLELIRAVQVELGVLWSDLMHTLPSARDVNLNEKTEAAKQFWAQIVMCWTRPQTFQVERSKGPGGDDKVVPRASLVSRVCQQLREYRAASHTSGTREHWRQVQNAFEAYWRSYVDETGELRTALAMRWNLPSQIGGGLTLSGVSDQESLTRLGKSYGCLNSTDMPPARMSDGTRLAVLAPNLVNELMSVPTDEQDETLTDENDTQQVSVGDFSTHEETYVE